MDSPVLPLSPEGRDSAATAIQWDREGQAMRSIAYMALCAATTATVGACGAGASLNAAPIEDSVASTATTDPAAECSPETAAVLERAANRPYGNVYKVLCSGDWAKALVDTSSVNDSNAPGIFLFHRDGGDWRIVQYGSGFNCINEGVPPPIAAQLEC